MKPASSSKRDEVEDRWERPTPTRQRSNTTGTAARHRAPPMRAELSIILSDETNEGTQEPAPRPKASQRFAVR